MSQTNISSVQADIARDQQSSFQARPFVFPVAKSGETALWDFSPLEEKYDWEIRMLPSWQSDASSREVRLVPVQVMINAWRRGTDVWEMICASLLAVRLQNDRTKAQSVKHYALLLSYEFLLQECHDPLGLVSEVWRLASRATRLQVRNSPPRGELLAVLRSPQVASSWCVSDRAVVSVLTL